MGYIGRGPVKSGAFRIIDDIASSFNGSTTGFTLQHNSSNLTPGTEQNLLIAVDGVMQEPIDAFTISGSTITFTSAPASGASFWGVELGDVGGIAQTIANGAVDTSQLADDAVTAAKLANSINTEITANTAKTGITSGQASAITANTAKVTNATHSGDVTGATALTIAAGAVDIAHLSASGTKDGTTVLYGNNTFAAAGGGAVTREGGNTTLASTTSTTKVDVLTTSSLSLTAATPYQIRAIVAKDNAGTESASVGLKMNTTSVLAASIFTNSDGNPWSGIFICDGYVSISTMYEMMTYARVVAGNESTNAQKSTTLTITAPFTSATITSLIIEGLVSVGTSAMIADEMHVYTLATS